MKRPVLIILLGLALSGLNSCATVFGNFSNALVLRSEDPTPAEVFLDGEKIGTAPGKIKLPPNQIQHGSELLITADGYQDQAYTLQRRPSLPYIFADLITTAGLGMAVDFISGSIYRPQKRKINYQLKTEE